MMYWLTFTPFLSIPMFLVNEDRLSESGGRGGGTRGASRKWERGRERRSIPAAALRLHSGAHVHRVRSTPMLRRGDRPVAVVDHHRRVEEVDRRRPTELGLDHRPPLPA